MVSGVALKFFMKIVFISVTFSLSCLINKLDTDRVRRIKYDEMFMMVRIIAGYN